MLDGINEDTVDFADNYSGDEPEPSVLPSRFPNLLVNGSQGIAVGLATNIPPHNLGEVVAATIHLIDNPEATPDDPTAYVQGPDFRSDEPKSALQSLMRISYAALCLPRQTASHFDYS